MAYNRALLGGASFVLSTLSSAGVNTYHWSQLSARCQDAVRLKQADVIPLLCPPGFDNHTLAGIIFVGGIILAAMLITSPLFEFVTRVIKGETI